MVPMLRKRFGGEDYEEKSTPWRRVPPTYKGSSTKNGRNKKQIRKDRKRNKKR